MLESSRSQNILEAMRLVGDWRATGRLHSLLECRLFDSQAVWQSGRERERSECQLKSVNEKVNDHIELWESGLVDDSSPEGVQKK